MNRLQKKCVIATVGIHLLLLTILLVGPAFYNPQPKVDKAQVLEFISLNPSDVPSTGRQDATPPPPTPPTPVQLPPTPQLQNPPPTPPKPVEPKPTISDRIKDLFTPEPKPEQVTPAPNEAKPEHKIQVNTQLVSRTASKTSATNSKPDSKPDNSKAIASAIKNLRKNLSPGVVVGIPGNSSAEASNYKDALATIYYNAWVTPEGVANDEADTIVKITVARDGTVVSSHIVTPSGDPKVDESVRRALNRVNSVGPLPDQSKSEQEFTIDFNLKAKQMLE